MDPPSAFCPSCGQKSGLPVITFWHLVSDFFSGLFNLDNRMWQTIKGIFVPGKLTQRFFAGQRSRYTHPVRLYLFISFVLFAWIGYETNSTFKESDLYKSLDTRSAIQEKENLRKLDSLANKMAEVSINPHYGNGALGLLYLYSLGKTDTLLPDTIGSASSRLFIDRPVAIPGQKQYRDSLFLNYTTANPDFRETVAAGRQKLDQLLEPDSLKLNILFFRKPMALEDLVTLSTDSLYVKYQAQNFWDRLYISQANKIAKAPADAMYYVLTGYSWMALLFIPLMALWLKFMYIRRKKYFVEHLVFTLHNTSFLFLLIILAGIPSQLLSYNKSYLLILVFPLYLLLSHRRFYGQSWLKSATKTTLNLSMGLVLLGGVFILSLAFRLLLF